MPDPNELLEDEEFIRIQKLNSIGANEKRRSIVYDKPVPGLDLEDTIEPDSSTEEQVQFTEDITNILSNHEEKDKDAVHDEVLKRYLKKLNKTEKSRYKKGRTSGISFFADVGFDSRPTIFDSVLVNPFITSFQGPVVEKQMKDMDKMNKDKPASEKNPVTDFNPKEKLNSDFSGIYVIMWMTFGWTAMRGIVDYLVLHKGDITNIAVINVMTEKLSLVFYIDMAMWFTSYFAVLIQKLVRWNIIPWESTGRLISIVYEFVFFFFYHFLVIHYYKLNWISRIFFFLHSMVYMMKMHSFAFYNGYLWNITEELKFSKAGLAKYKEVSPPDVIATLERSQTFCEYELSTQSASVKFPDNITVGNYTMFCLFPTLVYQIEYPRNKSIRWGYVFEKFCAIVGTLCLMIVTAQLYLYPYVKRIMELTKEPWPDMWTSTIQWFYLLVDLLPGFAVIFMLTFYFIWDALLNCVAELTRFSDRYFYGDWWNCVTFAEWSRIWNVPVHKFLLRHVFHSSMNHFKISSAAATWITFGLSSMLHEMSMYIIFLKFRPYMFLFQMTQIPTAYFSERPPFKNNESLCNVLFIFAIFFGTTTLMCLYLVY